jgi:hypothetical protein
MAHEDTRNGMLPANLAQAAQIVAAIGAQEGGERLGGEAEFVRKCKTDSLAAIIDRQDTSRFRFKFNRPSKTGVECTRRWGHFG